MVEFVKHVFDLDGHDFREVPITNVQVFQRDAAIWANVFGVEGNDFIGLLCRNDGAAVAAMAEATTAVVTSAVVLVLKGFFADGVEEPK